MAIFALGSIFGTIFPVLEVKRVVTPRTMSRDHAIAMHHDTDGHGAFLIDSAIRVVSVHDGNQVT